MNRAELSTMPLFAGVDAYALGEIVRQMRQRRFRPGEAICREREPGTSLFVIEEGLADVVLGQGDERRVIDRLGRGDVIGEMSLITREPRSATVIAKVPTDVLELSADAFGRIVGAYPVVLANLGRILSRRLARANQRGFIGRRRGEAVVLVVGRGTAALGESIVMATRAASPRDVAVAELAGPSEPGPPDRGGPGRGGGGRGGGGRGGPWRDAPERGGPGRWGAAGRWGGGARWGAQPDGWTPESFVAACEDLVSAHDTVLAVTGVHQRGLPLLLGHVNRVLLVGTEQDVRQLGPPSVRGETDLELALVTDRPRPAARRIGPFTVVRTVDPTQPANDVAWLGRHLARTKLGLALGAGGAKGYAHVGALYALQEAGYTVDYVSGSSIGALIGAWLALGMNAAQIDRQMRACFTPEAVEAMFKLSLTGMSTGLEVMTVICRDSTKERTFADLEIPLVAMTVDLNTRLPCPITEGPLWQALLASTALAGLFPPYQLGDKRLVDGLALVPVPVDAVMHAGADISVSVNLMSRETLAAWPGASPPEPGPGKSGSRMLDNLLEIMDLAQLDSSVRHAARADVVVTPRFGPASWRDFHLADLFLAAGRQAAEQQLPALRSLARPTALERQYVGGMHGAAAVHVQ